jgi:5-methylcytosine-specific restriction enzyme A
VDKLPFIPGQVYKRIEIHSKFGGNPQSGISPSKRFPFIFIFSNLAGQKHGYKDEWVNKNVYSYTGHGQDGDMKFVLGNLALREHLRNGKRVFLFVEVYKSHFKFESELALNDFEYFQGLDTKGKLRNSIKFFLRRVGATLGYNIPSELHIAAEPGFDIGQIIPNITERKGLITSRVGQGAYRLGILHRWEGKCAVTGFEDSRILIASHIHPWREANSDERLDIDNGILLSPNYDALFDRHLITFENSGMIVLSDSIEAQAFQKIGVSGNEKIKTLSDSNFKYLDKHRLLFNENH